MIENNGIEIYLSCNIDPFPLCYNDPMVMKSDLSAYRSRWLQAERMIRKERQSASLKLRWMQLNSAYAMAKGLGLLPQDSDEMKVFQIWADLREKATNQDRKI
jgi:hypothetical protein